MFMAVFAELFLREAFRFIAVDGFFIFCGPMFFKFARFKFTGFGYGHEYIDV